MMEALSQEQLQLQLRELCGDVFSFSQDNAGMCVAEIPVNQLYQVVSKLYKNDSLGFQFLTDICGIHYPDRKGEELCVAYMLHSLVHKTRLRLKVYVPLSKPELPTLTGIYASANWMERDNYDFFGLNFLGHPDLRRILNMDEMVDFPMRKEFPLEDPRREDKADYQFGR
jgi:NADH-quinone oxidoreductase subunit C